jgi:hypothetical protein
MRSNPGIAATMFRVLSAEGINIQMIDTSTIRITVVIARSEVERAVRALHEAFDLTHLHLHVVPTRRACSVKRAVLSRVWPLLVREPRRVQDHLHENNSPLWRPGQHKLAKEGPQYQEARLANAPQHQEDHQHLARAALLAVVHRDTLAVARAA